MKSKTLLGVALGVVGFAVALALPMEGLGLSGRITLGIFVLAAIYWILEPIPIYATSMLVIFLQVLLLSKEGFIFSPRMAHETEIRAGANGTLLIPATAASAAGTVFLKGEGGAASPVKLTRSEWAENGWLAVSGPGLEAGTLVITDAQHRALTAPSSGYARFFATLSSPVIMLFLGGFAIAAGAVKFGLDRNLTRVLLKPFGSRPAMVCLGLMLCTATLSAFMSNTATTAMMMTVVLPIVASLAVDDPFRKGIALAIPIAANVGGIATPIGTPPNAVALAALREAGYSVSFSSWMVVAVPYTVIILLFSWWLLMRLFKPKSARFEIELSGAFNKSPKAVAFYVVFAATVLLWVTENLHGIPTGIVAFLPIAALPALGVLDTKDIRGFSWEVLWLMAGGISLGLSMKDTGLASYLISQVDWSGMGAATVVVAFGLVGFLLANLISHTVSSTIIMPLAITVGLALVGTADFSLVSTIVSITFIISIAMALPISTPPNAIAMSTGIIETRDMAKSGVIIGIAGVALAVALALTLWPSQLG